MAVAFAAAASSVGAESSQPTTGLQAPEFALVDQFGQQHRSSDLADRHLIFVGGDRSASEVVRSWSTEIRRILQDRPAAEEGLALIRVADLRGVPETFKDLVGKRMRKRQQVPVLMDWDGEITEVLSFEPKHANVVLIDSSGTIRLSLKVKQPDAAEVEALREAIEELDVASASVERPSAVAEIGPGRSTGEIR